MRRERDSLLIRVYGDSLSLPRASEGIEIADTYPELLRNRIEQQDSEITVRVFNRSVGGASISELYQQFLKDREYFGHDCGGIVVVQSGIVDCAPRPIPPTLKQWIGRMPRLIRWPIVKFLHHARPYLMRAGISWRSTEIERFESSLRQWLSELTRPSARVYVINIAPTTEKMDRHSPGLAKSISRYNEPIAKVVATLRANSIRMIDVHGSISRQKNICDYVNPTDGHHITIDGHKLYADLIFTEEQKQRRTRANIENA